MVFLRAVRGAFFSNQDLWSLSDSAVEERIYLTRFANSVTVCRDGACPKVLRAFANRKVKFISVVEEIKGDDIKGSRDAKNISD